MCIKNYLLSGVMLILLSSCLKEDFKNLKQEMLDAELYAYADFEFETIKKFNITVSAHNHLEPMDGVYIEIYTTNPLNDEGTVKSESIQHLLYKGITSETGTFVCEITPAVTIDSVFVLSYYLGLERLKSAALQVENITVEFNTQINNNKASIPNLKGAKTQSSPAVVNGFYTLGNWDAYGVPDYLELEEDVITTDFLDDINASLPEGSRLPESHPQYLSNANDANLVLVEDAEVWVTFVHEGAGWHNSLGYYTYPVDDIPQSVDDIRDLTVIFPDVSLGSNNLSPGNKVQLYYLDPETEQYTDTFPSDLVVGWFLIAQGWSGSSISNGAYTHYSNSTFNIEADLELKKHNVLLYDEERERLLLGFEDVRRDVASCDQDFNDAVFYTSVSPVTAVNTSIYQPIDDPTDSDGDGTSDVFDEFPDDPDRAFSNYYPGEGVFGSLVYEDLWPNRGDYDFNDLVVDYNFSRETNAANEITAIRIQLVTKAIGASYHNAFGIQFNTAPENVTSVSGQVFRKSYLNIEANGTEKNQEKAVVIAYDDAFNVLPYPGSGICVNTVPGNPYVAPDTQNLQIIFESPVPFLDMGTPPYNPFIIINQIRGVEVHLPGSEPTSLADESLFGTGHDDSNLSLGKYYVSQRYLPWAINLPESFDYPIEKQDVRNSHLVFNAWATSLGFNYMDWYHNNPGYRNSDMIYTIPD